MAARIAERWPWLPAVTTAAAVVACYGTVATVALLSLLGIGIVVHEGAWAGIISVFAVLASAALVLGYGRHGKPGPAVLGAVGAALIVWTMLASYDRIVEIAGFAALVVAAIWDRRARR